MASIGAALGRQPARAGAPKVLTSDNMILSLAKKGELAATKTFMVVNATVVSKP